MFHGSLALPARLQLLARDAMEPRPARHLVRAGALTELARRGLLVDDDGIATPADLDSATGDAVLDGLLELVRESLPHRWDAWVTPYARVTSDAVREQLVAPGYVRAERRRVLGLFPSVEYVPARAADVAALRDHARDVLDGPLPAADVSEADAALVALAASAEPRTLVPDRDRARHAGRVQELTGRAAAAPGLGRVLPELCAALSSLPVPSVR
ncbi:GPP34 family phosphoprotein [Streptomyces sp. DH24]|uniref:GOLPH3/VPS74 family protein n=1 Tax=Streptomyces sp. DH24 TaxID=3040123 RepID=UPI002442B690|nr:GPP34 family phosphoprotein [Streptomyces sp. DH24]MDG9715938.1 GPP34 family phosphoprotein [Streptomyces sp. DH24]